MANTQIQTRMACFRIKQIKWAQLCFGSRCTSLLKFTNVMSPLLQPSPLLLPSFPIENVNNELIFFAKTIVIMETEQEMAKECSSFTSVYFVRCRTAWRWGWEGMGE